MITLFARLLTFASFAHLCVCSLKSKRRVRFASLGLFALLLLSGISVPARAQSVSFAGLETPIGYGLSYAEGVAVDGAGDVFIADSGNDRVVELPAGCTSSACQVTALSSIIARAVAVDKTGDLFVYADRSGGVGGGIVVYVPAGCTSTSCQVILNGSTFLYKGWGLAVDAAGDLFVASGNGGTVYEVTPSCIAAATMSCWQIVLSISMPAGVAVDAAGDVFITSDAPQLKQLIEILANCSSNCQVTILSDSNQDDGIGGVAVDAAGNIFFFPSNEFGMGSLVEIPAGCANSSCWTTLLTGLGQTLLGEQLAVDAVGDVFVVDTYNNRVLELERIAPNFGSVNVGSNSTLTLTYNISANDLTPVVIYSASVVTQGAAGLDFTSIADSCVGSYFSSATCSVQVQFAPLAPGLRQGAVQFGTNIGTITTLLRGIGEGPQVVFPGGLQVTVNNSNQPSGVATDAAGNVYFSGFANGSAQTGNVYKIPPGCANSSCYQVLGGGYGYPLELAIDGAGNIYVPDLINNQVYVLPPGCTSSSCQTGIGFGGPAAVALDGAGDIFVAEDGGAGSVGEVRVVGPQTTVGSGFAKQPFGVALDDNNDVFIAAQGGNMQEVPSVGTQFEFAPWLGYVSSVMTDAAGDVYDAANSVTEVPAGCASSACDIAVGAGFGFVSGLALDSQGNVYIADNNGATLYERQRSQAPTLSFPSTAIGATSSAMTVAIQNIGNQPLTFASFAASTNFVVDSGSTTCSTSSPLAVGASCNVGVDFAPGSGGALTGTLTISDDALNAAAATQTVPLQGTGTKYSSTTSVGVDDAATGSPWTGSEVTGASAYTISAVSGGGPAPTGSVTYNFYGNGTCSGSPAGASTVTMVSGSVPNSSTFGPLSAGTYSFLANYSGDSNYNGSTSGCASFRVSPAPTSINVTNVSPSSEAYGQDAPITITAVLSWSGGGVAPTASNVAFTGNGLNGSYGTTGCSAPSGNTITCTGTYAPTAVDVVGSYTEVAIFGGDSNYQLSESPQNNNFSITQANTSASVSLSGGTNPSTYGSSVTFQAVVAGEYGEIARRKGGSAKNGSAKKGSHPETPTGGSVSWSANTGCSSSPVTTLPATVTCTTSNLPVGSDTVTATYSGDSNHSGSNGSIGQSVNQQTPTLTVTSVSPSSEVYGQDQQVTITAALTWTGNGTPPTQNAVIISGNAPSNTYGSTTFVSQSGNTYIYTNTYTPTSADTAGTYTFSATFSGDSNYATESSTQTNNFSITGATSTTSVTSSLNPSLAGQSVQFTATISGEYGEARQGKGVPAQRRKAHPQDISGSVTWSANTGCGTTPVTTGNPGTATCTTTTLPTGTDTITASYSGDSDHEGSIGTLPGGQVVNPGTVNVTVGTSPAGLAFSVDGTPYSSAQNFTWNIGDPHTIATTSPQFPSAGTEDMFASWSDSGAISHVVTASASTTSYIASFNTTYQLTTAANPTNGGTVMPMSGQYYASNQVVSLTATANPNYAFSNWTGNVANPNSASTTVTMSGPQSVTANFVAAQVTVSPTSVGFGDVLIGHYGKKVVTVTNTGKTPVQIAPTTLTVTMGDASQFSLEHVCPARLLAGKSCLIGVIFRPDAVGSDAATLNIVTSAPGSPIMVPITAAGIVAPTVKNVSPPSGPVAGGTPVTITGTGFAAETTVSFGGAQATNVNVVSPTEITATTPTAAHPGAVKVTVTVNGVSGSLPKGFTYTP
jgi:hypothetical protein